MFFALLLTSLFFAADPTTQPEGKACEMCGGAGFVSCTNQRCDEGLVPCPKPCLKLSQGQWYVKDGVRWKKFTYAGGYGEASEHHLGQIVKPPKTSGGQPEVVDCPTCKGTTRVICPTCDGMDLVICPKCKGTGDAVTPASPAPATRPAPPASKNG